MPQQAARSQKGWSCAPWTRPTSAGGRALLVWLLLALALFGCRPVASGQDAAQDSRAAAWRQAPEANACAIDDDCAPAPLVNPDNPCCDTGMALTVRGRAYLAFRADWTRAYCAEVTCEPIPSPALPLPCALQGRCVERQCVDSCPTAP